MVSQEPCQPLLFVLAEWFILADLQQIVPQRVVTNELQAIGRVQRFINLFDDAVLVLGRELREQGGLVVNDFVIDFVFDRRRYSFSFIHALANRQGLISLKLTSALHTKELF
jgi:hypothetical protein